MLQSLCIITASINENRGREEAGFGNKQFLPYERQQYWWSGCFISGKEIKKERKKFGTRP
jgi:hypothetical protein